MLKTSQYNQYAALLLGSLIVAGMPNITLAQNDDSAGLIEEVVVTGSRRAVGSVTDLPSPVDIFQAESLQNQGLSDIQDSLRTLVPSFSVGSHPLSGTSSLVRPPNLRGLGADQVLVLVNSKRRHRAANIPNFSGGINRGTQGPDISNIPTIALKSVEVLRDGAAAQYGADAIAGVLNFQLEDDPTIRRLSLQAGEYYAGDGGSIRISGMFGIPIGDNGSLNLSGEYKDNEATVRAQQPSSRQVYTDAGWPNVPNPSFRWGNPEVTDDLSLVANLVLPFGASGSNEFYGHWTYNERKNVSPFFNRDPFRAGWFTVADPIDPNAPDAPRPRHFLVFNTAGDGEEGAEGVQGDCPLIPVPDLSDGAATAAAAEQIADLSDNPDCFSFLNIYPGGITPDFEGKNEDLSLSAGFRGEAGALSYDFSLTYGKNEVTYTALNNANPTYGPDSPTTILAGSRIQEELVINAQAVYEVEIGLHSPLNIAAGFEWHEEAYEQVPGEEASYAPGPYTDPIGLAATGVGVGTRGFGSFSPATSLKQDRSNTALYLDLETDILANWTVGISGRYEDFTDLGQDFNYKLATLVRLTDNIALRGTYSTGFHAPTPGQQVNAQSTVQFNDAGELETQGLLPPTIAAQLPSLEDKAAALTPETAANLSLGFIWESDAFSLTVDYYQIEVKDRITQTGRTSLVAEDRMALTALGFTNADEFASVSFFTNDFDTRTKGADIVLSVPISLSSGTNMNVGAALNYNETKVTRAGPELGEWRAAVIEHDIPDWRGNLNFTYKNGKWGGLARLNYYGSFTEFYLNTSEGRTTGLSSQFTVDLEASYDITDRFSISIGAHNLFDSTPTRAATADAFGNTYPVASPAGFSGGFFYSRLVVNFGDN